MVFPTDPRWRREYMRSNHCLMEDMTVVGNVRYRTWGTEQLLVRCIRRFMPWVRDVIILLSGPSQVRDWMQAEQVRIVYHSQFMPADKLPTFNSRAIEMYLHLIPGLADYFLYGNDDMFPLAPLAEEDFFQGGRPCLQATEKELNPASNFQKACMNGLNFVGRAFGRQFTDRWLHMGHCASPLLRSTCEMFWEKWPQEMQESVSAFRMVKNYNQYIYSWWQILSKEYIASAPPRQYVSTKNTIREVCDAIQTAQGIVCINDNEEVCDITQYAAAVRREIEKKLT